MGQRYLTAMLFFLALSSVSACGGGSSPAPVAPPPIPPVDTQLDWDQDNWDQRNWQ
jgi:hypothetical protein